MSITRRPPRPSTPDSASGGRNAPAPAAAAEEPAGHGRQPRRASIHWRRGHARRDDRDLRGVAAAATRRRTSCLSRSRFDLARSCRGDTGVRSRGRAPRLAKAGERPHLESVLRELLWLSGRAETVRTVRTCLTGFGRGATPTMRHELSRERAAQLLAIMLAAPVALS